ncbi:MAG: gamma-glutamylcyclotransferase [Bacteroidia bacterium]|nr:gamma-glutamylcyclotransferase [Bacteroidia bacterium]
MNSKCWYFAYGSNMHIQQLEERVGRKGIVRKVGYLEGYEIVFNKPAKAKPDTIGYANIQPREGSVVYGVLYELTETEMEQLDQYEGAGHPEHYQRKRMEIKVEGEKPVDAYVYIAYKTKEGLRPTSKYLETIIAGARENSLPRDYIQKLEQMGM